MVDTSGEGIAGDGLHIQDESKTPGRESAGVADTRSVAGGAQGR